METYNKHVLVEICIIIMNFINQNALRKDDVNLGL